MTSLIDSENIRALQSPFGRSTPVWWIDLDAHAGCLEPDLLTAAELHRAERMTRPLDARRFLASRHALRGLLASYMDCSPEKINYRQTESGKLVIVDKNIGFNLSRSQGWALITCSRHQSVGIDIEVLRPIPEWKSIVESVFGEKEKQAIKMSLAAEKNEVFLRTWVRKEACLKATGLGLTVPLSNIMVGADPATIKVSVRAKQGHWRVEVASLETPDSTVAALAVGQESFEQTSF